MLVVNQLFGKPGDTATETVDIWEVAFTFQVIMTECPPGYFFQSNEQFCKCAATSNRMLYHVIFDCNSSDFRAKMRIGYWFGYKISQKHDKEGKDRGKFVVKLYIVL